MESLISLKTARLAQEKGFKLKTRHSWYIPDNSVPIIEKHKPDGLYYIAAPTQSFLQKWLREVHNIDLWAQPFVSNQSLPDESYSYFIYKDGVWIKDGTDFLDFEESLEKGLQEALKLI